MNNLGFIYSTFIFKKPKINARRCKPTKHLFELYKNRAIEQAIAYLLYTIPLLNDNPRG